MNEDEYRINAQQTLSPSFHNDLVPVDILHGAIGAVTEAAELLDACKKALFYGKPLDKVNVVEELGDIIWYMDAIFAELGVSWSDARAINIAKLQTRYPQKFSAQAASLRDLAAERAVLESKLKVA